MNQIATITLEDRDSGDAAVIIVRGDQDQIALALSLRHGSDTEVVFGPAEAGQLLAALQEALAGTHQRLADKPGGTD